MFCLSCDSPTAAPSVTLRESAVARVGMNNGMTIAMACVLIDRGVQHAVCQPRNGAQSRETARARLENSRRRVPLSLSSSLDRSIRLRDWQFVCAKPEHDVRQLL